MNTRRTTLLKTEHDAPYGPSGLIGAPPSSTTKLQPPTSSSRLSSIGSAPPGRTSLLGPPRMSLNVVKREHGSVNGLVDGMGGLNIAGGRESLMGRPSVGGMAGGMGGVGGMGGMAGVGMGMGGGMGRTMGQVSRRSSQYTSRPSQAHAHLGSTASQSTAPTKDPRPIREKPWQQNAIRTVITFLVQAGYNQPLNPKMLSAPSLKDFMSIFKFLYAQLDPDYVWAKKFEEDVPVLLKGLRYPFADSINKSHLTSPGAMHSWPPLLAMLTWIIELIMCCDRLDVNPDLMEEDGEFGGGGQTQPEKIFFDYLTKAYHVFLAGNDDYGDMDRELTGNFDRRNELVIREVDRYEKENDILEREWRELSESESPLVTLEREGHTLRSDSVKFRQYILHLENKIQKLKDAVLALKQDVEAALEDQTKLETEKHNLQETIDKQEIRPEDVDRMNGEREALGRSLEVLVSKVEVLSKSVWEGEIRGQKRMDALDKLVQEYNARAFKLGLFGGGGAGGGGGGDKVVEEELGREVVLNVHAGSVGGMLNVDPKGVIKPGLLRLRTRYNTLLHKANGDIIDLTESLDSLNDKIRLTQDSVNEAEGRVRALGERYREEQERVGMTNVASQEEMDGYERSIGRMRSESGRVVVESGGRLGRVAAEYEQLSRQTDAARSQLLHQVVKSLVEIFEFHQAVQGGLEELEGLARGECEGVERGVKKEEDVGEGHGVVGMDED
ncbi:kinetochore-associated Ndc80 complex subunit ndc80 [Rhizophlyctis rosea]|nr:kinetochore-associated Ndc80 complex subunit ndc80 [Rhizophlyctis rosea]